MNSVPPTFIGTEGLLSFIFIVLTAISFLPQLYRLVKSSSGIPVLATCLNVLAAQGQFGTVVLSLEYMANYPPYNLNAHQITVQWLGLLLCFVLVVRAPRYKVRAAVLLPVADTVDTELGEMDVQPATEVTVMHMDASRDRRPVMLSAGLIITHLAAVFAATAVNPQNDAFAAIIVWSVDRAMFRYIWTVLSIIAPALQVRHVLCAGETTAFYSRWTLGVQAVLFTCLAIAWPFKLHTGSEAWGDHGLAFFHRWYVEAGSICVNNAFYALGQGSILLAILYRENRSVAL